MIQYAKAGTKHISCSPTLPTPSSPGKYKELLEKTTKAGITVSVIGLGSMVGQGREAAGGNREARRRPVHAHRKPGGAARDSSRKTPS